MMIAPISSTDPAICRRLPSISARITAAVAEPPKMRMPVSITPVAVVRTPATTKAGKIPSTSGSTITVASSFVALPTRCSSRRATG